MRTCSSRRRRCAAARPELADAVDPVVAKAMAKKPDDRYASARDLAAAVREALSQPAADPATRRRGRRRAGERVRRRAAATAPPAAADPPAARTRRATPPPSDPPRPLSRKRLGVAAAVVALGIVGAVLAVVMLRRRRQGRSGTVRDDATAGNDTANAARGSGQPARRAHADRRRGAVQDAAGRELRRRPDRALPPAGQRSDVLPAGRSPSPSSAVTPRSVAPMAT